MNRQRITLLIAALLSAAMVQDVRAASVAVEINYPGQTAALLDGAFVYMVPDTRPETRGEPAQAELIQEARQFLPYTQVIQAGDAVRFPNHDTVSHHVYSFSPAKVFELPLYSAEKHPPQVTFDRPGLVVLGCNIHDWMLAFVLVVDTPWYAPVVNNRAVIEGLPEGIYTLYFWYPSADVTSQVIRTVELLADTSINIDLLDTPPVLTQPDAPPRRPGRREEY